MGSLLWLEQLRGPHDTVRGGMAAFDGLAAVLPGARRVVLPNAQGSNPRRIRQADAVAAELRPFFS